MLKKNAYQINLVGLHDPAFQVVDKNGIFAGGQQLMVAFMQIIF
jgi:hypothetical protein